MTNRPATDLPDPEEPETPGRDDGAPKPRDPLHLTEGADPHGEVPVGPQSDVPLLRGPQDDS